MSEKSDITIAVKVTLEERDKVRAIAKSQHRTMSRHCRKLISDDIAAWEATQEWERINAEEAS